MPAHLHIFDLDDTLLAGDSSVIWHQFLVTKGIITDPDFLPQEQRLMALYALGKLDLQEYLDFTIAPLTKLNREIVDALVDECVTTEILPRLYPQGKALIEEIKQAKQHCIIISATVSFIVAKIAEKLAVDDAMGVDLAIENNSYTTTILGTASFREGKVTRLQQWLKQQPQSFQHFRFYTDSINDLPLCKFIGDCRLINPCPQLKAAAQMHNATQPAQSAWLSFDWNLAQKKAS